MGNKRVFITGGSALLGTSLISGFIEKGYQVNALIRKDSKNLNAFRLKFPSVAITYGSLKDLSSLDLGPHDIFVHFAWDATTPQGRSNPTLQYLNYAYSMDALTLAAKMGCKKFIFAGSQAEYGKLGNMKLEKEGDECEAISEYGKFKHKFGKEALSYCSDHNIVFLHLRIFSVYGFGLPKTGLLHTVLESIRDNTSCSLGPCTQLWNYLHLDDFRKIVLRLIDQDDVGGIINIASNETMPLKQFIQTTYSVCRGKSKLIFGSTNPSPEGLVSLNPDISKMIEVSGFTDFIPFASGIKESYKCVLQEKYL